MTDIIHRHKVINGNTKSFVILNDRQFNNLGEKHIESLIDSGAERRYLENKTICIITSVWTSPNWK